MGEIIAVIGLNLVWLAFVLKRDSDDRKERQKLLDRIMAKSLEEVKDVATSEAPEAPEKPPEFIPFEEADPETFERSIRKQLGRETIKDRLREKLRKARNK